MLEKAWPNLYSSAANASSKMPNFAWKKGPLCSDVSKWCPWTRSLADVTQKKLEWIHTSQETHSKDWPSFPLFFLILCTCTTVWPRICIFFTDESPVIPRCWTGRNFVASPRGTGNITLSAELKLQWLGDSKHLSICFLIPTWDVVD